MRAHRTTAVAAATTWALSAAAVATALALGATASPAAAAPGAPCNPANGAQCPEAEDGRPGSNTGGRVVPLDIDIPSGGPKICHNGLIGSWMEAPAGYIPERPADVPADATFWLYLCGRVDGQPWPSPSAAIDDMAWSSDGPPPTEPSPEQVADALWASVQGELVLPTVAVDPPSGGGSVLKNHTFVAITNPQPATTYVARAGDLEVWIDVIPLVTFHPGEPGADAVACDDDGTAYVRNGPEPDAQAGPGTCTHLYTQRTGFGGDPTSWTADVTITWNVTWDSTEANSGGTLAAAPSVTTFPRIVEEMQGVVVNRDGG